MDIRYSRWTEQTWDIQSVPSRHGILLGGHSEYHIFKVKTMYMYSYIEYSRWMHYAWYTEGGHSRHGILKMNTVAMVPKAKNKHSGQSIFNVNTLDMGYTNRTQLTWDIQSGHSVNMGYSSWTQWTRDTHGGLSGHDILKMDTVDIGHSRWTQCTWDTRGGHSRHEIQKSGQSEHEILKVEWLLLSWTLCS